MSASAAGNSPPVRLRIAEAPVTRWEMALGVGDDIERTRPG
ncbi:hypothetical protein [Kitasatospora sp. NPDC005751]